MPIFVDAALARRLERAEGAVAASFVDTRARLSPETGAVWKDFSGTYAMFDEPGSPMTQTFGLGMFEPVAAGALLEIERFFLDRGADVDHELSPLAGVSASALLVDRGYRPIEASTVLVRPLDGAGATNDAMGLRARPTGADEAAPWIEASARGWGVEGVRALAWVAFHNARVSSFAVERDGKLIATGSMGVHEGVALLAGASTVPEDRGRGAQKALLVARLAEARTRGCDVALMVAEPGSTSQRNAERNGFRVAYTRIKWRLSRGA
jgi:GNAT superfamily N-acetyltransferase